MASSVRHRRPPPPPSQPDPTKPPSSTKKHAHHRAVPHHLPLVATYVLFGLLLVLTVAHFHLALPPPKPLDAPATEFSEARARVVLANIMSAGYHPLGSDANDVVIPRYLLSEIHTIKTHAAANVKIEVDVQRPSGAFFINFLTPFENVYANVTNILVRLTNVDADEDAKNNSLLVSAHFDGAVGGAAASDDGVNIAIMVELLRKYSLNPPKHGALMFNFNGAEETIMQAAHGFITQHPWAKTIRAFINLEAAGAGGRELLFQTGTDELALAYAEGAKYPHASIVAQELFQSGVIAADTDFRVYRDYGGVAGMDFAYISNGYVYHTSLDQIDQIQQGAVQRLGENVVGVIERLANVPGRLAKVASTPLDPHTLFADVMGVFMIAIEKRTAMAICWAVLGLAVLFMVFSRVTFRERMSGVRLIVKAVVLSLIASLGTAGIMSLVAPMSWFSSPFLGAALYVTPTLAALVHCLASYTSKLATKSAESLWYLEESLFQAMMLCWMVFFAIGLSFGMMTSYLMGLWIFFPLIGQVVCSMLRRLHKLSSTLYVSISLAAVVVPVLHTAFIVMILFLFVIPLWGRAGTEAPADIAVAGIFTACTWVMVSFSCRFFCFVPTKNLRVLRNLLLAVTVGTMIFAASTNPYTDATPKRLSLQHVQRSVQLPDGEIKLVDSGIWVNSFDAPGLKALKPCLQQTRWNNETLVSPPAHVMDQLEIYGEVPWYLPIHHMFPENNSWYLPAEPPVLSKNVGPTSLEVLSTTIDPTTKHRKVHFTLTGPSHMNIFIDATKTTLVSWSLGEGADGPATTQDGATYVLALTTGRPPAHFDLTLEAATAEPIELVVVGHYLQEVTPELAELAKALPSWAVSTQFVSSWTSRVV